MSISFYFIGLLILCFIYGSIYGVFIWLLPDQCECGEDEEKKKCIKLLRDIGIGFGFLHGVFLLYIIVGIIVGFFYKGYEKTKSGIESVYQGMSSALPDFRIR
jgi:hypothetical protein